MATRSTAADQASVSTWQSLQMSDKGELSLQKNGSRRALSRADQTKIKSAFVTRENYIGPVIDEVFYPLASAVAVPTQKLPVKKSSAKKVKAKLLPKSKPQKSKRMPKPKTKAKVVAKSPKTKVKKVKPKKLKAVKRPSSKVKKIKKKK